MLGFGMNDPRQMQQMLKQLGIKTKELDVKKVVMETGNGRIVVENPKVTEIDMKGVKTYQVVGETRVETGITSEDVSFVAEQAGVDEEKAKKALEETGGDVAEAILKLKG